MPPVDATPVSVAASAHGVLDVGPRGTTDAGFPPERCETSRVQPHAPEVSDERSSKKRKAEEDTLAMTTGPKRDGDVGNDKLTSLERIIADQRTRLLQLNMHCKTTELRRIKENLHWKEGTKKAETELAIRRAHYRSNSIQWAEKVDSLRAEEKKLHSKNADLEAGIDVLREQLEEERTQNNTLVARMVSDRDRLVALQRHVCILKREGNSARHSDTEVQPENAQLKLQVENLEKEVKKIIMGIQWLQEASAGAGK